MPGTRFTDIRRFESLDSTNQYLLAEARSGAADGVVAVADFQTAGRGRLGRRWEAPAGSNLLMSVLLRPGLRPDQRHLASSALCLAAGDAVERVAGVDLAVKWPNDLLAADGRKVAGVLAEADVHGPEATGPMPEPAPAVVVGIGINVNWPVDEDNLPPELVGVAGSLRRLVGRPVDRDELLQSLLEALEPRVDELGSAAGRTTLVSVLRSRCSTIGAAVRVERNGESLVGTAVDLTPDGHLVVERDGEVHTVLAGDVVHLRPVGGTAPASGPTRGRL
jgi:BirA family transcriptional regulator, biotin operon repressor / biotin---[acetyl-CoA-carboxylase] ligase